MLAVVKGVPKTALRLACETKRRIDRRKGRFAASLVAKIPTHGAARCTKTSLLVLLRAVTRARKFSRLRVFLFLAWQGGSSAEVSASGENEAEEIYHEISARRRCMWVEEIALRCSSQRLEGNRRTHARGSVCG